VRGGNEGGEGKGGHKGETLNQTFDCLCTCDFNY